MDGGAVFERYTEKARRLIFFARYEASQFGSPEIESEHLLLGLLREGKSVLNSILGTESSEEEIRRAIASSTKMREKAPTSVDLPLTDECKRILAFGAEEAFRLNHKHIGVEHLLLGILREKGCLAAKILRKQGLELEKARKLVLVSAGEFAASVGAAGGMGMGSAGGAGPALSARVGTEVQLVDADSSDTLLTYRSRPHIPRIGEVVLIRDGEGGSQSYRVQDVVWEFDRTAEASQLQNVKVRVAKEKSA